MPSMKVGNKLWMCVIAAFICIGYTTTLNAQHVFMPHYTTKDGLPSNQCFYTLQDSKGFLWVATDAGVSRYDGAVFENFTIDDGLPDNQILQLHEDSKGRIWFLSLNGQLSFFYNGKIYNQDNHTPLKQLNFTAVVVSFLEDSKKRIWFGTNNNVLGMWDGKKTVKYISKGKQINFQSGFIYEDKNNDIWVINKAGNFLFANHTFTKATKKIAPLSHKLIVQKQDKRLYYIDEFGLKAIDSNDKLSFITPLSKKLINSDLGHIYVDSNALWLSNSTGVTVINYQQPSKTYLNGVNVSRIMKDRAGNMWFSTTNGLYKLAQVKDQLYYYRPQNSNDFSFKSILKDSQERLWLGTANGNIHVLDLKSRVNTSVILSDKKKFNTIKQLSLDVQHQKIYFASDYCIGNVSATYPIKSDFSFLKEGNDETYVVKSFAVDTSNKLSVAMSSGVAIINDRRKLTFSSRHYREQYDFFKNRAYRVYYDQAQHLWFSNISGLTQVKNEQIFEHFRKDAILTERINDIVELGNGAMALATDGYGIVIFADGNVQHVLNRKTGLHNNIIHRLFVKDDVLWAISNSGINRIELRNKRPKISAFDDINGVLADNLNDLFVTKDTVYLATNNGLIYFAPGHSLQRRRAPAVYITSIIHKQKQLDLSAKTFTFKPNDQEITINYSAVDFKNKNITYRYRLKSTNSWVETKNRKLVLTSLSPGTYDFEIAAKNQNSNWGASSSVKLVLNPKFYQTWWFMILMLLLGAYLVYSTTISFTRRKRDKEQEALLLKNKILTLEQRALQAMMNPHFVFNVMNSIQHFINTKNTISANKLLTGFARLIRRNMEICTQSYISLADEIDYIALYLSLEKSRFGEKLTYHINIAPAIDREEILIPSMLLQPYIENAIWHGIMPKEAGGTIIIEMAYEGEEQLFIKIIDDGVGIDNALQRKNSGHESKGMNLIRDRINLLNEIEEKRIQLNVSQNGQSGTTVRIIIPISTE